MMRTGSTLRIGRLRSFGFLPAGMLLASLLLVGCQGAAATATTPSATPASAVPEDPLDGSYWELLSMKGRPVVQDTVITLNFTDGNLGGTAGCNRYGAAYHLEGNRLKLEMVTLTAMLCTTPAGVMEQEQAYIDILSDAAQAAAATIRIAQDAGRARLEIGDALGVPLLVFQARQQFVMNPEHLPGTSWRLAAQEGTPMPGAGITFSFLNAREFSGFAGCRQVYGSYQARGDRISFPFLAMIGPDCHENEQRNLQESEFTDALSRVSSYHLAGSRLDLATEQGGVISFLAAEGEESHPEDAVWKLAASFGPSADPQLFHRLPVEPLPGSEITLEFDGQRASGRAGCNEYFAPYTMTGERLVIDSSVMTDMHCAQPEGVMRQEQDYLRMLSEINEYRVLGGQLWLTSDSGQSLLFIQKGLER